MFKSICSSSLRFAPALFLIPLLSRGLGSSFYGSFVTLTIIGEIGNLIFEYSFNSLQANLVASSTNINDKYKLLLVTIYIKMALFVLILPLSVLIANAIFMHEGISSSWVVIFFVLFCSSSVFNLNWWFKANAFFKTQMISELIVRYAFLLFVLLLNNQGFSTSLYFEIVCLAYASIYFAVYGFFFVRTLHTIPVLNLKFSFANIFLNLSRGFPFFLSASLGSSVSMFPQIFLSAYALPSYAGYFALAFRVQQTLKALFTPIFYKSFPHRVKISEFNPSVSAPLLLFRFLSGTRFLLLLQMVLCAAVFVFSDYIIRVLGGLSFIPSSTILKVLAFTPIFYSLNQLLGVQSAIALGLGKQSNIVFLVSSVLAIASFFVVSLQHASLLPFVVLASEMLTFGSVCLLLYGSIRKNNKNAFSM